MKHYRKSIGISIFAVILLLAGVIGYSQTQFNELNDILFRVTSPQIRLVGTGSVRDLAGTASGKMALSRPATVTTAATATLGISDCGGVIVATAASGTQVLTLPAVANGGCMITLVAGNAGGEILVNAAAAGTCVITSFGAVGATPTTAIVTDTTCNTGLKNTAATNAVGDSLTLVSDGTQWLGVGISSGIWALQ